MNLKIQNDGRSQLRLEANSEEAFLNLPNTVIFDNYEYHKKSYNVETNSAIYYRELFVYASLDTNPIEFFTAYEYDNFTHQYTIRQIKNEHNSNECIK